MSVAEVRNLPVPNQALTEQFLLTTVVDDIQLVAIPTDGQPPYGRWFGDDADAAAGWAVTHNRKGHGIYWTVNSAKPGLHKKPTKAEIRSARFLHVDLDPATDGSFDREGMLEHLAGLPQPPAFVIDSGGGLQAFWRLADPGENLPAVERLNQRIALMLGGDSCHNIDRIMRLPGTVNFPNAVKIARGRSPRLATVVVQDQGEMVEAETMYSVLPVIPTVETTPAGAASAAREDVPVDGADPVDLDAVGLKSSDRLWSVIMSEEHDQRSERVMHVAGELARRGVEDQTIVGVLLNPELPISRHCFDQPNPLRAAKRAVGKGRADARAQKPKRGGGSAGGPGKQAEKAEVSEDMIALAFTVLHGGDLLYDFNRGRWCRWTGVFWEVDETDLALDFARKLARQLGDGNRSIGRYSTAAGVEKFARSDRTHAVTSDGWDADPLLLGTPGGTIDLRTGYLNEPRREDRITRQTGVGPAHGEPTLWLKFLNEALAGDQEMIDFLQEWSGYCLTGLTSAHALLFIYGPGGNGKSVFLNVLLNILGTYGVVAAMETFTASKNDRHSTELAMLRGARLVTASETEEGRAWAEAKIKAMTGGDPITARFMRQDNFTFRPQFKLTIAGNHAPALRNVDDAMRRRFNIAPFIEKPAKPDPQLEQKLVAEYPQILAWMIAGCRRFLATGLTRPAAITSATDDYFAEQDVFGQWIGERCNLRQGAFEASARLYADWEAYAKAHGEYAGTSKSFGAAMRKRNLLAKNSRLLGSQQKTYFGVELVPTPQAHMGDQ